MCAASANPTAQAASLSIAPPAMADAGLVGPRRRARQENTAMMPEPVGSAILVTP
jgi:hypothetical protein